MQSIIIEAQGSEVGSEERKFGDLYASFMDEERVQQLGASPLEPLLAEVAAVSDIPSLLATAGRMERAGSSGFLQLMVDNDPGQPDRYLVFVEQGGLGLPDESYYREEKFADVRIKYVDFIERMLTLAGLDDTAARAERIMILETDLSKAHWDNVRTRDSQATYNPMPWAEFAALAAPVDLDVWLAGIDGPEGAFAEVVVREPSFIEGLGALLIDEHLASWRDWLAFQVIRSNAAYLSDDFVAANFDFYGRTLTGTPRCGHAGSAASRWWRARWARQSAAPTWTGTSRRRRRSRWMCSSRTSSRPTGRASRSSRG